MLCSQAIYQINLINLSKLVGGRPVGYYKYDQGSELVNQDTTPDSLVVRAGLKQWPRPNHLVMLPPLM